MSKKYFCCPNKKPQEPGADRRGQQRSRNRFAGFRLRRPNCVFQGGRGPRAPPKSPEIADIREEGPREGANFVVQMAFFKGERALGRRQRGPQIAYMKAEWPPGVAFSSPKSRFSRAKWPRGVAKRPPKSQISRRNGLAGSQIVAQIVFFKGERALGHPQNTSQIADCPADSLRGVKKSSPKSR